MANEDCDEKERAMKERSNAALCIVKCPGLWGDNERLKVKPRLMQCLVIAISTSTKIEVELWDLLRVMPSDIKNDNDSVLSFLLVIRWDWLTYPRASSDLYIYHAQFHTYHETESKHH